MRQHRYISVERLEAIATAAIVGGYGHIVYDDTVAGMPARRKCVMRLDMDCENPYIADLFGRYSANHKKVVKPMWIELHSRCRKCEPCRKRRAMFWRGRAFTEYQKTHRTIFGTLTTSPEFDMRLDAEIQVALAKRGTDFARLPEIEQFRERVKYGGREVTSYLKRLRGSSRSSRRLQFSYLLIAEAHDSVKTAGAKRNRPHWHVLFHETDQSRLLVTPDELAIDRRGGVRTDKYGNPYLADTSFLKTQWTVGFSTFLIAGSPQAATYVCKYLTKEASFRIRASFRYGTSEEAVAKADGREAVENSTSPKRGGIE